MAADPYEVLGIARTADADEIRRAYCKLAKTSHPDLNPGNKAAEERFKAINGANDLLSDPDRRAKFDRGEIDAAGDPRHAAPPGWAQHAQGPDGARYGNPWGEAGEGADYQEMFADFLNGGMGGRGGRGQNGGGRRGPRKGHDRAYSLSVEFLDAVNGATQRLSLPGGGEVEVRIPPGVEDGQTLRLREKGDQGRNGGPAGDALIEILVRPHPAFTRDGSDILLDLPVTLAEAVLGAKVPVPTASGSVNLSIPANSANGARMRLRGRGIPARGDKPAGDQYVTLRLVLDARDSALAGWLRDRTDAPAFDPRAGLGAA